MNWLRSTTLARLGGYGLALAGVAVAVVLRREFPSVLAATPFVIFYPVIMIAAVVGGAGPGILASLTSAVCVGVFFGPTRGWESLDEPAVLIRLGLFLTGGIGTSLAAGSIRASRAQAREQAEAVRQSQQRLRATFDNAALGIVELADDDRIIDANERMCQMLGYGCEELVGKRIHEVTAAEDRQQSDALNAELHAGRRDRVDYEKRYLQRDGKPRWVRVTVTALRDAQGRWVGSIGTAEDIQQRKVAEERARQLNCDLTLRNAEQKRAAELLARNQAVLSQAGQMAHLGAWDIEVVNHDDLNANTLRWSDEVYRIFGYEPGQVPVTNDLFFQHVHPDDRAKVGRSVAEAIGEHRSYEIEHRIIRADGVERVVMEHADITFDQGGRPLRIVGAVQDITEAKRAAEDLQTMNEQLQAANEELSAAQEQLSAQNATLLEARAQAESERHRYFDLFESAPDGYVVTDARGIILEANRAATTMLGPIHGRLEGMALCQYVLPEQQAQFQETLSRLTRARGEASLDLRVGPSVHGPWIDVAIRASAEGRGGGTLAQIRWTLRDVGEIKRIERKLRAARELAEKAQVAAEQANRAKDQFLAVLSHELRTPLTPVVAAVSMLQEEGRYEQASREALEIIHRNVEMEARLIDDLLDVTRIVRGKIELKRRPTLLCEVIQRAVEVCRPDIDSRQIHFGVDIGACAPYQIDADPARLQQVFWNLLKNAVKFTPHGGCIGIRCWREEGYVVAEVADSGEGIEPHVLPNIFNPFEQGGARMTRQFGGLGLGLTITKGVVEMHGGTIEAYSEGKGKGATFRVRLPLCAAGVVIAGGTPSEGMRGQDNAAPARGQKLRILLVEDHGDTAKIMRCLLTRRGYEVEVAGDVATALDRVEHESFDLLLSDLGLPDGSGVDLMRSLREHGRTLPGIALSGYGQEEDIRRSKEAGFAAHLTKPTDPDVLTRTIGRVIHADVPTAKSQGK